MGGRFGRGSFLCSASLLQETGDVLNQIIKVFLDNSPYDPVVDAIVAVGKDVPEGDDAPVLPDLR